MTGKKLFTAILAPLEKEIEMKERYKCVMHEKFMVAPKYPVVFEAIKFKGTNMMEIEEFLGQKITEDGREDNGRHFFYFVNDRNEWDDLPTKVTEGQYIIKAHDTYHVVNNIEGPHSEYEIVEKIVDERHFYTAEEADS